MSSGDIDALFQAYFDGDIGEAELATLQDLLQGDATARRAFATQCAVHGHLRVVSARGDELPAVDELPAADRQPRRRAHTTIIWWPVAAAAGLLLVVGWFMLTAGGQSAPAALALRVIDGRGDILRDGQPAAAEGQRLRVGDRLTAAAQSPLVLAYEHEETRLELAPNTRLAVQAEREGKRFRLEQGALTVYAAAQPAGRPLVISSAEGTATIVGTVFTLQADEAATRLLVHEGLVELAAVGGGRLQVGTGDAARAGGATAPQALARSGNLLRNPGFEEQGAWRKLWHPTEGWFAGRQVVDGPAAAGGRSLELHPHPEWWHTVFQDVELAGAHSLVYGMQLQVEGIAVAQVQVLVYWLRRSVYLLLPLLLNSE